MKELVLHIGMHKTGSSSIQLSLIGFDLNRIRYAKLKIANHSIPMSTAFSDDPYNYHGHVKNGRTSEEVDRIKEKVLARLRSELSTEGIERLIISGEDISYFSKKSVRRLKHFASPYVDKFRVVAYVRDPIGYASSAFQQRIQGGWAGYDIPMPGYRGRFEKFIEAFGPHNVVFRKFSRKDLVGQSVVRDFASQVGIPDGSFREKRTNESVPEEAVKLLHLFNRHGALSFGDPRLVEARQGMIRTLSQMFTTKFVLPTGVCSAHLDYDDIRWMESVSGFDLGSSKSRDGDSDEQQSIEEYLNDIPETVLDSLREYLSRHEMRVMASDDALALMNKFYYSFLLTKPVVNPDVIAVRNLALRLEAHPDFSLKDARTLMTMAHQFRPTGPFIRQKLDEYEQQIRNDSD